MSPKTKEAQQRVRDNSRSKIMEAALKLFAEKGYHASSMDAIAKKANVSKGLIYNYFDTKEDLLKKIVEEALTLMDQFTPDLSQNDPKKIFKSIVDMFVKLLKTHTDYLRLIHSLSTQVWTFDFIQDIVKNKTAMYDEYFKGLLIQLGFEGSPGEVTELECIFDGASSIYYIMGDDSKLETLKSHLIKKYCS